MATWGPRLVTTAEATALTDLEGAKHDLDTAAAFCERLEAINDQSLESSVMVDALSTAIAIRYARCFTSGVRAKLTEDVLTTLLPQLRQLHEYLLVVRDKHVAHSVNALEENHVTIHLRELPDPPGLGGVGILQARTLVLSKESAAQVRELCRAVATAVGQLATGQRAAVEQYVQRVPIEEVYRWPEPVAYAPDPSALGHPRRRP